MSINFLTHFFLVGDENILGNLCSCYCYLSRCRKTQKVYSMNTRKIREFHDIDETEAFPNNEKSYPQKKMDRMMSVLKNDLSEYEISKKNSNYAHKNTDENTKMSIIEEDVTCFFNMIIHILLFSSRTFDFKMKFITLKDHSENFDNADLTFFFECDTVSEFVSNSQCLPSKLFSNIEDLKYIKEIKCTKYVFRICTSFYYIVHTIPNFEELYDCFFDILSDTNMLSTFKQRFNILKEDLVNETLHSDCLKTIFLNTYFCECYLQHSR